MMMQMSEDEIERIFKEIDKDESGSITKKEAVRACRRFKNTITIAIHNSLMQSISISSLVFQE